MVFNNLMTHDVKIYSKTTDGYGKETRTLVAIEKGFFEYNERRIFNTDGVVIDSKGLLFLKADSAFSVTSGINWDFEDVKNNRIFRAYEPQVIDDPRTGVTHHYEVILI